MDSSEIISGEKIQELCDIYCGTGEDFQRNPRISKQLQKQILIENINESWNNPPLIFCYSHRLLFFTDKLHFVTNPFVFVTHNEDTNIGSDYIKILESPLLQKWFAQNPMIQHPKLLFIPIGIANSMWTHGDIKMVGDTSEYVIPFKKTSDFYFYFSTSTNWEARESCKQALESKGLLFGKEQQYHKYLMTLSSHKFAICPEGNGIDCHRTWECYYLGVIPILLESEFTQILQKYLPCIVLKSWEDFNPIQSLAEHESLSKQLAESQQYLKISYYREQIQDALNSINTCL